MLSFGYNAGLPAATTTAWGCRAIRRPDHRQRGRTAQPAERQWARIDALLDHLNRHVEGAWRDRAGELLRSGEMNTRRAAELMLFHDSLVIIKGNTNASAGYLYVCAYLLTEADEGCVGSHRR